jgi:hypothetical protein
VKDILDGVSVIGIMGLAKNTGKTTTLNKIIEIYPELRIGLTSIGLDGESLDQVNFLPKPAVFVRPNMVIATSSLCLEASDVDWKLIEKTECYTPLGQIMIVEILSSGTMMIAGPTTNLELSKIVFEIKKQCDKVLIDGAFNRMTFSSIHLMEGVVLASGASYSADLDETLKRTSDLVNLFSSKQTIYAIPEKIALAIFSQDKIITHPVKKIHELDYMISDVKKPIDAVYIRGAITSKTMDILIESGLKSYVLIIDDPSKWMASQRHIRALSYYNIRIEVIRSFPILMVTINPFSPMGLHYDEHEMMKRFKANIHVPIYNVKEESL